MQLRLFVCLAFLFNTLVHADENIQFSGFGTLGVVISDSDRYGYRKDISVERGVYSGDVDFRSNSLLGLQMDYAINQDFDVVAQTVLREVAEPSLERYITLGFLRYKPSVNWSFRLGRTAPDIFLITEYRDVDFAYAWATAPNEVYGMIPYRYIDGADASYTTKLNYGTFSTSLFAGVSDGEISSGYFTETVELDKVLGISLSYNLGDWVIKAKHSRARIGNETDNNTLLAESISSLPSFIWPEANHFSAEMLLEGQEINYSSLSSQLYLGNWLLTGEVAHIDSDSVQVSELFSGYFSLAYQLNEQTFFGVYSATNAENYAFDEPDVKVALIPELVAAVETTVNFYASNQYTISLGWRWDFNAYVASTLQFNHTKIEDDGGTLWLNKSLDTTGESINTVLLSVSFSL